MAGTVKTLCIKNERRNILYLPHDSVFCYVNISKSLNVRRKSTWKFWKSGNKESSSQALQKNEAIPSLTKQNVFYLIKSNLALIFIRLCLFLSDKNLPYPYSLVHGKYHLFFSRLFR